MQIWGRSTRPWLSIWKPMIERDTLKHLFQESVIDLALNLSLLRSKLPSFYYLCASFSELSTIIGKATRSRNKIPIKSDIFHWNSTIHTGSRPYSGQRIPKKTSKNWSGSKIIENNPPKNDQPDANSNPKQKPCKGSPLPEGGCGKIPRARVPTTQRSTRMPNKKR